MADLTLVQGLKPQQQGLANLLQGVNTGLGIRDTLNTRKDAKLMNQILAMGNDQDQIAAARASGRAGTLLPKIQEQQAARLKADMDRQETQARIGKLGAESGKLGADAQKTTFEINQGRVKAVTDAVGGLTAMGNQVTKTAVLQQLMGLTNLGVLTPEQAMAEYEGMPDTPEDLQLYIQSKIPISDQTTRRGQDTVQETALRGQDVSADTARYGQQQQNYRTQVTTDAANQRSANQLAFEWERMQQLANRTNSDLIESNGQYYLLNKRTREVQPVIGADGQVMQAKGGADIPGNPEYVAKENNRITKLNGLLDQAGKLLPNATSGYVGAGVDQAARMVGYAPDGAVVTQQLKTIAGQITSMMPRMEGPQSNMDVLMYKEMAGDLANPTLPVSARLAALKQIKALNDKYATVGQQQIPATLARPTAQQPTQGQQRPPINKFFEGL